MNWSVDLILQNGGDKLCSKMLYPGTPSLLHNSFDNLPAAMSVNLTYTNSTRFVPIVFTRVVKYGRGFKIATQKDDNVYLIALRSKNISEKDYPDYYNSALPSILCYRLGVYYLGELDDDNSVIENIE